MTKTPQVLYGPRPLRRMLQRVMKPTVQGRSFTEARLLLDWPQIIGVELAERCFPERLIFPAGKRQGGCLIINVDSGSSLLIQHSEGLIIDWINSYFGYLAVNRLKLMHTFISLRSSKQKTSLSTPVSELPKDQLLEEIQQDELKKALYSFKATFMEK